MWKLFRFMKEYRRDCVLGPLFKLLEVVFELAVPLVMAGIIDEGIGSANRALILKNGLLLVLLAVVAIISVVTAQYFSARAAVGFATRVRHEVFAKIQRLSFDTLDELGTSTLVTRITSDVNQVQSGINLGLRLLLRSPFVVFGALLMAFFIDTQAAAVFSVVIAVLLAVVFAVLLWCIPRYRTVQQNLDAILGITKENLDGVRVLRAFNQQEAEQRRFSLKNEQMTKFNLFVGRITALLNPATVVIINLGLVALIHTGALRVSAGALTQGQVIALSNYMGQILVELVKLANLIITIAKAWACGNRIEALLEVPDAANAAGSSDEKAVPAIIFDGVTFAYPDAGGAALRDLSFSVPRGSVFGIIGGTGAGKSSLVNLIPAHHYPTHGTVRINGLQTAEWETAALRGRIGMVAQKARLFRGTIRDNILWGRADASEEAIERALTISQAKEFVMQRAKGLNAVIEQGGGNLSGGERQRLSIARALVREPEILILDDSTSALDAATDMRLRQALRALADTTVVIVSQRTSSIRHADQILVLDGGACVGLGTHDALLETCPIYREIYDSQYREEAGA